MKTCEYCNKEKDPKAFYDDKNGVPETYCKRCSVMRHKTNRLKDVAEVVVSFGVGAIIGNAIKATTPVDVRLYRRLGIIIGGHVLSRMASEHAKTYTDKKIDIMAKRVNKIDEIAEMIKTPVEIPVNAPEAPLEPIIVPWESKL